MKHLSKLEGNRASIIWTAMTMAVPMWSQTRYNAAGDQVLVIF